MIAKQGYAKIESKRIFAKWKRRWLVLMKPEESTQKEVLLFKNEKCAQSRENGKRIPLEHIENIYIQNHSPIKKIVELTFQDGDVKRIQFSSEAEAKEWHEQFNVVCFDSVLGKQFKEVVKENTTESDLVDESNLEKELFQVYLQPSAKLNISGECTLKVTVENIIIYDAKCLKVQLVSWPIRALRRFGFDATRFTFEAGRRCDTGEGIFVFKTTDGERIHQMVQNNAHLLAGDPHNVSSTDDEEFGFRALPPLPQE